MASAVLSCLSCHVPVLIAWPQHLNFPLKHYLGLEGRSCAVGIVGSGRSLMLWGRAAVVQGCEAIGCWDLVEGKKYGQCDCGGHG